MELGLSSNWEAFNLGRGQGYSVLQMLEAMGKACGRNLDYKYGTHAHPPRVQHALVHIAAPILSICYHSVCAVSSLSPQCTLTPCVLCLVTP